MRLLAMRGIGGRSRAEMVRFQAGNRPYFATSLCSGVGKIQKKQALRLGLLAEQG